jgi:3-methyladenine DNA glycosylase AlkD
VKEQEIRAVLQKSVTLKPSQQQRFFKTSPGDYASGDLFLGITVPILRKIAKNYQELSLQQIKTLLDSGYNEERLLALIILVRKYEKADIIKKELICDFYLTNRERVNNWNLVDASAHLILGKHLLDKSDKEREILFKLAASKTLWDRRIAIVATWWFIKHRDLSWTYKIAEILLEDRQDLIHKATGWMLREAFKIDPSSMICFIEENIRNLTRTTLRYAIEKLPRDLQKYYLAKK